MPFFDFFQQKKEKQNIASQKKTVGKKPAQDKKKRVSEIKKSTAPDVQKETEKIKAEKKTGSNFLVHHVTEKTTTASGRGVHTFKVKPRLNKIMIKNEIKKLYNVEPIKVNITKAPSKRKFARGKWGVKSGFTKALVYLKEGDSIGD